MPDRNYPVDLSLEQVSEYGCDVAFIGLLPTLIIGTEAWTPTLWVLYEGFYYPGLVLGLALAKSGLTIARVVGDSAAHLVTPVVNIVKAFRLVEVNQVKKAEDIV